MADVIDFFLHVNVKRTDGTDVFEKSCGRSVGRSVGRSIVRDGSARRIESFGGRSSRARPTDVGTDRVESIL